MKRLYFLVLASLIYTLNMAQDSKIATLLIDSKSDVGEGAIWDYVEQRLFWIDIPKQMLYIHYPDDTTKNIAIKTPSKIGTVVPIDKDKCVVALADGIYEYSFITKTFDKKVQILKDNTLNRLNDGKCAPNGVFWVGSMHNTAEKPTAALYSITSNFEVTKQVENITVSNGIAWSLDGTKMYYIDTPTQKVVQYDYADGKISNPKDIIIIPKELGSPDGSTIDANGNLWIAMWNGGCVTCWNPNTGALLDKIEVPAWNITSVAFGGSQLDELYITSARLWMPEGYESKYPHAGSVFYCKPGVKGVKAMYFPK